MSDGDIDETLERDHGPRNAMLAVGAFTLAAIGAWALNDRFDTERRTRELRRAADAWSDLSRCVAGEHPRVGKIARDARRAQLRVPSITRSLPRDQRAREWPWRCAPYARTMTRALFESRSDDPRHRLLNQFVSQAATDLEHAELHAGTQDTRHYLDELFAAAERAGLPRGRASTVPLPPEPMFVLDPSRVRPLFRASGSSTLVADEAFDAGALRVVLGRGERRLCDFDRELDAPDCQRVPALDGALRVQLTSTRYPRMPGYVRSDAHGVGVLLHPGHPEAAPIYARAAGAFRFSQDGWYVLGESGEGATLRYDFFRDGALALAAPALPSRPISPPRMLGPVYVALIAGAAVAGSSDASVPLTDAGVIAGSLATGDEPWRWQALPALRSRVNVTASEPALRACNLGDSTAVVVYGDDGHASVLFWHGGDFVRSLAADARVGSMTCSNDRVRMAWYTTDPVTMVHVTTCTSTVCTHAQSAAPYTETVPRVVALGERVLVVYTNEAMAGLRYRYGPLATIADAHETVMFDDALHDGVDLEAPPVVLARGELAVVLATRKDPPNETWAIRVDAQGYQALRPRP